MFTSIFYGISKEVANFQNFTLSTDLCLSIVFYSICHRLIVRQIVTFGKEVPYIATA